MNPKIKQLDEAIQRMKVLTAEMERDRLKLMIAEVEKDDKVPKVRMDG